MNSAVCISKSQHFGPGLGLETRDIGARFFGISEKSLETTSFLRAWIFKIDLYKWARKYLAHL